MEYYNVTVTDNKKRFCKAVRVKGISATHACRQVLGDSANLHSWHDTGCSKGKGVWQRNAIAKLVNTNSNLNQELTNETSICNN